MKHLIIVSRGNPDDSSPRSESRPSRTEYWYSSQPHRTLKHLLRSGEPHAAMGQVECDDVLAHERLTEVAIHNHIGD